MNKAKLFILEFTFTVTGNAIYVQLYRTTNTNVERRFQEDRSEQLFYLSIFVYPQTSSLHNICSLQTSK